MTSRSSLEPLPPAAADALAVEAQRPPLDPARRARILENLQALSSTLPAPSNRVASSGLGWKLSSAFLIGGMSGAALGIYLYAQWAGPSPLPLSPGPPSAPPPAVVQPAPVPASVPAAAKPSPEPPVVQAPSPPSRKVPTADALLAEERAWIDRARSALDRGHLVPGEEALRQHQEKFPSGRLSEERELLWIQLELAANQVEQARSRAERFAQQFPASLLLPAVKGLVATEDNRAP